MTPAELRDHPARVLVVDDRPENRQLLLAMLAADGYVLATAASGEEALALVAQYTPDLILLDVMMPGMDGYDVARILKRDLATRNIPIILVTALDSHDATVRGLDAGAEDLVSKPVDGSELRLRVRNLLRLKAYGEYFDKYSQQLEAEVASRTADLVERTQTLEQQAALRIEQATLLEGRTRDLTAALERGERANRVKDGLLATVSHELRTPLNAILGWSDILERNPESAPLQRGLSVIKRNALALEQVVTNLLDISIIDAATMRLDTRPVDLRVLVSSTIDTVRPAATAKRISIVSTSDDSLGVVLADVARLRQVLWHLLSNAVKFTPDQGTVSLHLRLLGDRVRLDVSDDGIGIAPGFLSRAFDEFSQADNSPTRTYMGLGLGLTIVRQLVEMQGGTVTALSGGTDKGSTFRVDLPRYHPSPGEVIVDVAPDLTTGSPDLTGVRVLVIDDDADTRETVALMLDAVGAMTVAAESASAGLHCLLDLDVDVIVADIVIPHRDGLAFIQDVRTLPNLRKRQVPAVALTSLATEAHRHTILAAGFQKYAAKPVSAAYLVRLVADACGRGSSSPGKQPSGSAAT